MYFKTQNKNNWADCFLSSLAFNILPVYQLNEQQKHLAIGKESTVPIRRSQRLFNFTKEALRWVFSIGVGEIIFHFFG